MSNSELPTRVSTELPNRRQRLVDARPGRLFVVAEVEAASAASLLSEGVGPGVELELERKLALGGPVVVRLGRARLALARSLAAEIVVEPAAGR